MGFQQKITENAKLLGQGPERNIKLILVQKTIFLKNIFWKRKMQFRPPRTKFSGQVKLNVTILPRMFRQGPILFAQVPVRAPKNYFVWKNIVSRKFSFDYVEYSFNNHAKNF